MSARRAAPRRYSPYSLVPWYQLTQSICTHHLLCPSGLLRLQHSSSVLQRNVVPSRESKMTKTSLHSVFDLPVHITAWKHCLHCSNLHHGLMGRDREGATLFTARRRDAFLLRFYVRLWHVSQWALLYNQRYITKGHLDEGSLAVHQQSCPQISQHMEFQ